MALTLVPTDWSPIGVWDGDADKSIGPGFAPDNVGAQNAKSLQLDPEAGSLTSAYRLAMYQSSLKDARTMETWVKFDADGLGCALGHYVIPDGTDPIVNAPVGMLAFLKRNPGNIITIQSFAFDTPLSPPIGFDAFAILVPDPSIPFKMKFSIDVKNGTDHVVKAEVFTIAGPLMAIQYDVLASPFVGASSGDTMFYGNTDGTAAPSDLVHLDDLKINDERFNLIPAYNNSYLDQYNVW